MKTHDWRSKKSDRLLRFEGSVAAVWSSPGMGRGKVFAEFYWAVATLRVWLPLDWEEQKKVSSNYPQDFRIKHLYRKIQLHSLSIFGKRKLFP